jgi:dipeptidase
LRAAHRLLPPLLFALLLGSCSACSNILVSGGASADGSHMVAYNADSGTLFGAMSHWPARDDLPAGTMRDVYNWDFGRFNGRIPEANRTYNVMGNANEMGVVIGETTQGGLAELSHDGWDARNGTVIDYGSLIWITLQVQTQN